MNPEHTKNIKKFIKKYKSVLKLPFMKKLSGEPSIEAIAKPIVQILPSVDQTPEEDTAGIAKLAAKYDPTAKISGGFGKSPIVTILKSGNKKEAALTGEVKGDGPETIVRTLSGKSDSVIPYSYLKPTNTPRVMSSGNKLISLPKTDVKKLVDLSLTKQITNKITKTKNNEYTLNIPEYGIGKNILSGLMKVAAKATPVISKAATKIGSEFNKKISPLTDALKSAKNMGMSLISEEKQSEPSYDSFVETSPTTTTAPEAAAPVVPAAAAAPAAAGGSISAAVETPKDAPTKIDGGYGSGVGPGTSADELKAQAESAQAALPEQEAPGTAGNRLVEGIVSAVGTIANVATIALPGVGGAAMGALKGVAGMASGAGKVAGGLGKAAEAVGAASGSAGAGGGGGAGAGGGGMGVPGGAMDSILGAVGVAAVGGGALAAVGGIAAGVGGVASGIGAAVGGIAGAYATVGGKLIDAVLGTAKKNETPPVNNIMNDSRSTTTVVNSISNQYDIYRKTADDSFMLPNHRREYG